LLASTISAPLTAFASEEAARLVLDLSLNCPLCNNFSPPLLSTTKRNLSPLLRISILPAIIVLLALIGIRVYAAQSHGAPAGLGSQELPRGRDRGLASDQRRPRLATWNGTTRLVFQVISESDATA
jgi:hypothetical protein